MKHPHHTHPGRHKPHHSDHSGAHAIGTHEHMVNAENPFHGVGGQGGMPEGSPQEEASETPQQEAAEQSTGIPGAPTPGPL
jgi:hypothetical protein